MIKSFKDFFENGPDVEVKESPEDLFTEVTGVPLCDNLKTFIAWLVLKKHINPSIRLNENERPKSLYDLRPPTQIKCLVKALPNLRSLAQEFNMKWGNKLH
jgi:hypothetical protein